MNLSLYEFTMFTMTVPQPVSSPFQKNALRRRLLTYNRKSVGENDLGPKNPTTRIEPKGLSPLEAGPALAEAKRWSLSTAELDADWISGVPVDPSVSSQVVRAAARRQASNPRRVSASTR